MNTKGNVIADKEIDQNAFRLSVVLGMGKWHHFMEWLYGKKIENELNEIILYLSTYRGESINLTLNLKGIFDKMQWINSFLRELKDFLAINSVNKPKNLNGFNGAVFKDFTPNSIYYGIHPEFIENFQYESFEDNIQKIKVEVTNIILLELREKKVNIPHLLAFTIILIKFITDRFCHKGFKNIVFMEKTSIRIEESKYQHSGSIYPIIMRYIEFANRVIDQLMIEPHYLKLGHTLENMLDSFGESEDEKIKGAYSWILKNICSQLGIEDDVHSQIRFGLLHFPFEMNEMQA